MFMLFQLHCNNNYVILIILARIFYLSVSVFLYLQTEHYKRFGQVIVLFISNIILMCMFHYCLEWKMMLTKILDPQYMMLLNQVKQYTLILAKVIQENLDKILVMTKWFVT